MVMHDINCRIIQLADYVIATGDTVRGAAKIFGISKSTVHKDLSERLIYIDAARHEEVRKVLERNLSERHLRGGEATKHKFAENKK